MSDAASGWPGPDENRTIDEMIAHPDSPYWADCNRWIDVAVATLKSSLTPDEREELASRVKDKVWSNLPRFRRDSSLKTWIFRILYNTSADLFRERKSRRNETSLEAFEGEYGPLVPIVFVYDPTRQQDINRDLLRRVLDATRKFALTRKDPKRAIAILQLWLEGAEPADIAALLCITPQIVYNVLFLLRQHLQHLAAEWFGETDSPDPPDSE